MKERKKERRKEGRKEGKKERRKERAKERKNPITRGILCLYDKKFPLFSLLSSSSWSSSSSSSWYHKKVWFDINHSLFDLLLCTCRERGYRIHTGCWATRTDMLGIVSGLPHTRPVKIVVYTTACFMPFHTAAGCGSTQTLGSRGTLGCQPMIAHRKKRQCRTPKCLYRHASDFPGGITALVSLSLFLLTKLAVYMSWTHDSQKKTIHPKIPDVFFSIIDNQ